MPNYRLADSLVMLRDQVNGMWPNRKKDSDGWIGDTSHSSRASDHNPDSNGIVKAIDITRDPASGCDSYVLAQKLLDSRDDRIKYIISNHRIASGDGGPSPWAWRRYTGKNPHDHHCHISVKSDKAYYDNERMWKFDGTAAAQKPPAETNYPVPPVRPLPAVPPTVRKGDRGDTVKLLQRKLGFTGGNVDGDFGRQTEVAMKAFQLNHRLVVDGVCGPQSWIVLNGSVG